MTEIKLFFAIGMKQMETMIINGLPSNYKLVGEAVYREAIVKNAFQSNPDILILRETLSGTQDILSIVNELRIKLPDTRIIFLSVDRVPGDRLLAELVNLGVYDLLAAKTLSVIDVNELIKKPNKFTDVAIYRQNVSLGNKNEILFQAPNVKEVVKEVVKTKTVYVDGSKNETMTEEDFRKDKQRKKKLEEQRLKEEMKQRDLEEKQRLKEEQSKKKNRHVEPKTSPNIETTTIEQTPKNTPFSNLDLNPKQKTKNKNIEEDRMNIDYPMMNGKQKILTFVGGEHGVGNSQIAFNTAINLGKRGFKTIFIELKEEGSTIEYLYQLSMLKKGLDYVLHNLEDENFTGLENSIVRISDVREINTNQLMQQSYKEFPSNVDYLFFSPDYILEKDKEKKHIDPILLKELCMHLFFQMGYHYVILDAEPNLFNPLSEVALGFGTHVFYTLTQDVCHIGRAVRNVSEINKRINITNKLYYIINKFDDQVQLSKKDIEEWLESEVASVIPMKNKDFMNANLNAQPIFLYSKDKQFKKSFEQIVDHILQN